MKFDGEVIFTVSVSVHQGGRGAPVHWSLVPGPFLGKGKGYPSQVLRQGYPFPAPASTRTGVPSPSPSIGTPLPTHTSGMSFAFSWDFFTFHMNRHPEIIKKRIKVSIDSKKNVCHFLKSSKLTQIQYKRKLSTMCESVGVVLFTKIVCLWREIYLDGGIEFCRMMIGPWSHFLSLCGWHMFSLKYCTRILNLDGISFPKTVRNPKNSNFLSSVRENMTLVNVCIASICLSQCMYPYT